MSVKNFIPEVYSAQLEEGYSRAAVTEHLLDTRPDSDIATGNAVKIFGAATPTVQDYAAAGRTYTPEELELTDVTILVDQERVVSEKIDDIDRRQAAGDLGDIAGRQGAALAKDSEKHLHDKMIAGGSSINVKGAPGVVTIDSPAKAKTALRKIAAALDAAEVPEEGRAVMVNPAFKELLVEALSDSQLSSVATDAQVKNKITELYGLNVHWSVNFTEKTPVAIGFASNAAALVRQLDKVKADSPANSFKEVISTLQVYGAGVTRPAGVAVYVSGGTEAPIGG